jgi:hypothetical protein
MAATMTKEAAPAVPTIDSLRRARVALNAAIADGADHLVELRDLVEDALIEQIIARRSGVAS